MFIDQEQLRTSTVVSIEITASSTFLVPLGVAVLWMPPRFHKVVLGDALSPMEHPRSRGEGTSEQWSSWVSRSFWKPFNVGIAIINQPFLMVYTIHLWWLGGWFILAIPTLYYVYIYIYIYYPGILVHLSWFICEADLKKSTLGEPGHRFLV